jgi:hypothetical protein
MVLIQQIPPSPRCPIRFGVLEPDSKSRDATDDYSYTPDMLNLQSVNDNGAVTNYTANGMNQYTEAGQGGVASKHLTFELLNPANTEETLCPAKMLSV